jgi:hypothetical protein
VGKDSPVSERAVAILAGQEGIKPETFKRVKHLAVKHSRYAPTTGKKRTLRNISFRF